MLQTLPTSMQLELLQRLREAKMARNRESFQQRAAQPASFSSFQMEEYLKASALRRAPLVATLLPCSPPRSAAGPSAPLGCARRSTWIGWCLHGPTVRQRLDSLVDGGACALTGDRVRRRRMDSVKDAMNASVLAGQGGVQTRRIAAEEGREYILQARQPAATPQSAA